MSTTIENIKKRSLPCIVLRGIVPFPDVPMNFEIDRTISRKAAEIAMKNDTAVFLVCQNKLASDNPKTDDLSTVGTTAKIKQIVKGPGSQIRVIAEPKKRALLLELQEGDYLSAVVMEKTVTVENGGGITGEAMMRDAKSILEKLVKHVPKFSKELWFLINTIKEPGFLADLLAVNVLATVEDKQSVLSEFDPLRRLELLLVLLENEKIVLEEEEKIQKKVVSNLEAHQREMFLREQMKVIQNELGEADDADGEIIELLDKLNKIKLPKEVRAKLDREIKRLQRTPYGSAESTVARNYIDTCFDIPWCVSSKDVVDIGAARKILDADHYGLEKVKQRIYEYLATKKLAPELGGQILCLVGPPGTGKSSIAVSVARSMKRKFVRVSLGGIRDEADIRGHRKTYIGSMPGRIVNALIQAKTNNPLVLLDEIDKLTRDSHGDPASAVLEVLDGEQNKEFRDHFVEIPVDLSKCVFIATANTLSTVPAPLLDRMEVIELSAYTRREKIAIFRNHLEKKQFKRHGLNRKQLKITDEALGILIDDYTCEAGVRNLERELSCICRRAADRIVEGTAKSVTVTENNLSEYVSAHKVIPTRISAQNEIGIVNGMAYTEAGGDLLKIEAVALDGTGKLELTGSLGDVMKESAKAAVTYIRSIAQNLGINPDFYKTKDIHIHVPEGAVPKDGPSAGVTIATALASELSKTPVRNDVAMTGEINLHGQVLAIGGLKEKTMAAYTAGVRTIIIPKDNIPDISDIDPEVRAGATIIPCSDVSQVLEIALVHGENGEKTIENQINSLSPVSYNRIATVNAGGEL